MTVVRFKGVTKAYDLKAGQSDLRSALRLLVGTAEDRSLFHALSDVSFEVEKGEVFGIIGKNGSGKSTILKLIAGITSPSAGSITVDGLVSSLIELGAGFHSDLTGRENVFLSGSILGLNKKIIESKFNDIIDFSELVDFIDVPVKKYSSGMYARLGFAVATAVEPNILLIDEVLAVGDVFFRQKCYKRLTELKEKGVSIIFVSHAMGDVEQFCDEVLVLDRGRTVFLGSASEAVKQYYLLEHQDRRPFSSTILGEGKNAASSVQMNDQIAWPVAEAFIDPTRVRQVSNGWARCLGVALCDGDREPRGVFQQGERATFFYEFELLQDIEVPIGGIVIQNDKGVIVHGKSTLEYGTEVPGSILRGSRIRFRQDVSLELAIGEYTFEVGLATISRDDFDRRGVLGYQQLSKKWARICHTPNVGQFAVVFRKNGYPVQLLHHGVANLPGSCQVTVQSV